MAMNEVKPDLDQSLNKPLLDLCFDFCSGKGGQPSRVGVEIESEFQQVGSFDDNIESAGITKSWRVTNDNSLRHFGKEFVSIPFVPESAQARELFHSWSNFIKTPYCVKNLIKGAPRASIHVHVSAHGFSVSQILSVITAYSLIEGVLVHYSGKARIGNNFALRIPEASDNIRRLCLGIKEQKIVLPTEDFRYSALNLSALRKFGTFEFRMMGSESYETDHIKRWTTALRDFVLIVKNSGLNSVEIVNEYFNIGPQQFVKSYFPTLWLSLTNQKALEMAEEGEDFAIALAQTIKNDLMDKEDFRTDPLYTSVRKMFWSGNKQHCNYDFSMGVREYQGARNTFIKQMPSRVKKTTTATTRVEAAPDIENILELFRNPAVVARNGQLRGHAPELVVFDEMLERGHGNGQ